jgi:hypothetical protein
MTLPTFFIIGAPKAGTTSLHHYLDQHPQVQMSAVKEPRFFAGPANGIAYPADKVDSLDEYERLFDPAVQVRGESSTDYATHPRREGAPQRIKELVPEAKFLYMVRDPVARSISHYKMAAALLDERRTLQGALEGDLDEPRSRYIAPSLYATQLELYLRHFPRDRILVVDQADLLSNRRLTLKEIFSFLEVDEHLDSSMFEEELLSSGHWRRYPKGYSGFVGRVISPRVRWIPKGLRQSARRSLERFLWRPLDTTLDEGLRTRLEDLYTPEVARLRTLTGKSFASWSV